jgi:cupin 2 domain-containing protein
MLNNIFSAIPQALSAELFETLLQRPGVHIERIVSKGHTTPEGTWYDQAWDEWVLLLQGGATLLFKDGNPIDLKPGDYCLIPAHAQHRVSQTVHEPATIWLAVHLR